MDNKANAIRIVAKRPRSEPFRGTSASSSTLHRALSFSAHFNRTERGLKSRMAGRFMLTENVTQSSQIRLSVIVPAFNEGQRIGSTLKTLDQYLNQQYYRSEVVVVDDGSTDDTRLVVRCCMMEMPRVRLISGRRNRGKGWAVRQGMLNASGAYRVFMDADNSTSIGQWEKSEPLLQSGVDVVVGSRWSEGALIREQQPALRRIIGRLFRFCVREIFALPVYDTQTGFKIFTAEAAEDIFWRISSNGWVFDIEVLLTARRLGYQTAEVGVEWRHVRDTRVRARHVISIAAEVLRIAYRWNNSVGTGCKLKGPSREVLHRECTGKGVAQLTAQSSTNVRLDAAPGHLEKIR